MSQKHLFQKILFDCERMKYPNTGLYHFCLHLGKELLAEAKANHKKFSLFINPVSNGLFGNNADYVIQKSHYKYFNLPFTGFDIWHSTFQGSMYLPKSKKIKKVFTVHDLNFLYDDTKLSVKKNKSLRELQTKIDRCDAITAISEYTKSDLLKFINLKGKSVSVIHNGCNIPQSILPEKPAFINNDEQFLFTIGTITAKKNFHVLPCLLTRNKYKLVICGIIHQESYLEKIWEEAKRWNVADRIILPGSVLESEKWWLLQNCTAFLFPSLSEGFGLPVIEAMHFGKPVLLSNLTSLPEIGGDFAYYFNNFEPEHMQQVLEDGLLHYSQNKLSTSIQQWALQFNWKRSAHQYISIYNSLL